MNWKISIFEPKRVHSHFAGKIARETQSRARIANQLQTVVVVRKNFAAKTNAVLRQILGREFGRQIAVDEIGRDLKARFAARKSEIIEKNHPQNVVLEIKFDVAIFPDVGAFA